MRRSLFGSSLLVLTVACLGDDPRRWERDEFLAADIKMIVIESRIEKDRNLKAGIADLFANESFVNILPKLPEPLRHDPRNWETYQSYVYETTFRPYCVVSNKVDVQLMQKALLPLEQESISIIPIRGPDFNVLYINQNDEVELQVDVLVYPEGETCMVSLPPQMKKEGCHYVDMKSLDDFVNETWTQPYERIGMIRPMFAKRVIDAVRREALHRNEHRINQTFYMETNGQFYLAIDTRSFTAEIMSSVSINIQPISTEVVVETKYTGVDNSFLEQYKGFSILPIPDPRNWPVMVTIDGEKAFKVPFLGIGTVRDIVDTRLMGREFRSSQPEQ